MSESVSSVRKFSRVGESRVCYIKFDHKTKDEYPEYEWVYADVCETPESEAYPDKLNNSTIVQLNNSISIAHIVTHNSTSIWSIFRKFQTFANTDTDPNHFIAILVLTLLVQLFLPFPKKKPLITRRCTTHTVADANESTNASCHTLFCFKVNKHH